MNLSPFSQSQRMNMNRAPEDVFHDVMEGMGILASLPTSPAAEDARRVTRLLTELQA